MAWGLQRACMQHTLHRLPAPSGTGAGRARILRPTGVRIKHRAGTGAHAYGTR